MIITDENPIVKGKNPIVKGKNPIVKGKNTIVKGKNPIVKGKNTIVMRLFSLIGNDNDALHLASAGLDKISQIKGFIIAFSIKIGVFGLKARLIKPLSHFLLKFLFALTGMYSTCPVLWTKEAGARPPG